MMGRPFAVFDIDGTLIRWQLYHALADELARGGLLDAAGFQAVRETRTQWKNRAKQASFQDYEQCLVRFIDDSITAIPPQAFDEACQRVVEVHRDQVYTYTRDFIADLKAKDYLLFAVSASPAEVVGLVAAYYGFDDFGGSHNERQNGRFTGRNSILKGEKKLALLKQMIVKHGAVVHDSIGVGDSEGDIPMLASVAEPIVFNPTSGLFAHAKQHGWKIVIERKNVIYELEANRYGYTLKD